MLMERQVIRHPARHMRHMVFRRLEIEGECVDCPDGLLGPASCPDCEATMVYRGRGRLRNGVLVHHFECVHSPFEVHAISIVIDA
jgi:hypothetical protein